MIKRRPLAALPSLLIVMVYSDHVCAQSLRAADLRASVPPSGDVMFWSKTALLADRATQGGDVLKEAWPIGSTPLRCEQRGDITSFIGSRAWFSAGVTIEQSEIRLRSSVTDTVALASLDLSGVCIGLAEVRAHYPEIVGTGSSHPGVPGGKVTWTAYGNWGGLWFSFPMEHPRCLSGVSFHPGEVDVPLDQ